MHGHQRLSDQVRARSEKFRDAHRLTIVQQKLAGGRRVVASDNPPACVFGHADRVPLALYVGREEGEISLAGGIKRMPLAPKIRNAISFHAACDGMAEGTTDIG